MRLRTLIDQSAAVIFDFDGILADSEPLWYESSRQAFARFGHHVDAEEYWLHWASRGEGIQGEIARHGLKLNPAQVAGLAADRKRLYQAGARSGAVLLHHAMFTALQILLDRHKPCAIASSSTEADIRAILSAGQQALPCPLVGHRSGLRKKPAPDIFSYTAGLLGVTPSRCLVVEDTVKGLRAAQTLGMACIIIQTPHNRHSDFSAAELVLADHTVLAAALRAPPGS